MTHDMKSYLPSRMVRAVSGFTLIELLIVITIIGMLSTMTLLVVGSAMHSARVASTESTIARIDTAVCEMYETYANRQINVKVSGSSPIATAKTRLHHLYDTMRMEMPTFWEEVVNPPQLYNGSRAEDSPLRQVYMEVYRQGVAAAAAADGQTVVVPIQTDLSSGHKYIAIDYDSPYHKVVRTNSQAKLLYQIVMNGNPEAREMFGDKGISVLDSDGLPCFVDAWGKPIYFLRWAPGFSGSDRQPDLWKWTGSTPNQADNEAYWRANLSPDILTDEYYTKFYDDPELANLSKAEKLEKITNIKHRYIFNAILNYPDPLDLVKIRRHGENDAAGNATTKSRPGFMLVPLVYSAGADGEYGIAIPSDEANAEDGTAIGEKLLMLDPFLYGYGAPHGNDGYALDNIHNQSLGGR